MPTMYDMRQPVAMMTRDSASRAIQRVGKGFFGRSPCGSAPNERQIERICQS